MKEVVSRTEGGRNRAARPSSLPQGLPWGTHLETGRGCPSSPAVMTSRAGPRPGAAVPILPVASPTSVQSRSAHSLYTRPRRVPVGARRRSARPGGGPQCARQRPGSVWAVMLILRSGCGAVGRTLRGPTPKLWTQPRAVREGPGFFLTPSCPLCATLYTHAPCAVYSGQVSAERSEVRPEEGLWDVTGVRGRWEEGWGPGRGSDWATDLGGLGKMGYPL